MSSIWFSHPPLDIHRLLLWLFHQSPQLSELRVPAPIFPHHSTQLHSHTLTFPCHSTLSARVTSRIDVDICLLCIELSNWVGVPSCRIGWEYPYTSIHTSPPGYHVHCRHSSFRIYSLLIRVRSTSHIPCPGLSSPMDFLGVPLFHTTPLDSSGIFPSAAHSMCFPSLSGASLSQELRPHLHWHMLYWMHLCRTV